MKIDNYFLVLSFFATLLIATFATAHGYAQCRLTAGSTFSGSATSSATCLILSYTVSGSNRLLVVRTSTVQANPSSVKYNGINLTLLSSKNNGSQYVSLWYLIAPPTGAFNGVITGTSGFTPKAGIRAFTGAHQPIPFGTSVSLAFNSSNPSVTVSSATGQKVIDVVSSNKTLTVGTGQTSQYSRTVNNITGTGS